MKKVTNYAALKFELRKKAIIRSVFKKHNITLTERTYCFIREFENNLMSVQALFVIIDREQLKRNKKRLAKIKKIAKQLETVHLGENIINLINPLLTCDLPNINQERNAVIQRCSRLAHHLWTTEKVFYQQKEALLYLLLAELTEVIKPGLFDLSDGLTDTHARAFREFLTKF